MWSCIKKTVDTDSCTMHGQIKTRENQWIKTQQNCKFLVISWSWSSKAKGTILSISLV